MEPAAAARAAAKKAKDAEKEDRPAKRRVPPSAEEALVGEDAPAPEAKPFPEKKQAREGSDRGKVSTRPERNVSSRRRERNRAGGAHADADALETVPGSPSGSERSNSLRSPHRGGKLLSSRDSARLRLISKRLRRDRDHASKLSPVKTRAARRAERERERASSRNGAYPSPK